MMVYTSHGLLYATADYDSVEALLARPPCDLQVWFCPIGHVTNEWVTNGLKIKRLLDEYVWDEFIGEWDPVLKGPLVLPEHCEEVLRRELGNRLIGPIDEVPGPRVDRRASMRTWVHYVMHELTKFGDDVYEDDGPRTDEEKVEPEAGMSPDINQQLSVAEDQLAINFPREGSYIVQRS